MDKEDLSGWCEKGLHASCRMTWCTCKCHEKKKDDRPKGCVDEGFF